MQKTSHQLDYLPLPPARQRRRWEIARPVWLAIALFCGFVEFAGNFATNGRIIGWADIIFVLVFAVIGVIAAYMAM